MAITEYYVSAAGGGAHDGTSEANAWTLSEAITANNALGVGGAAGRRYNVKGAHTARGATDTISVGGTTTSPAIWRGHNSTIGDLDTGTRNSNGALDTTNFPDIGYNSGFRLAVSADHIILANLDLQPNVAGAGVYITTAAGLTCVNLRVVTQSTHASANAVYNDCPHAVFVNCDFATAASGGAQAFYSGVACFLHGCVGTSPGAIGFSLDQNMIAVLSNCTAYGCSTHGVAAIHANTYLKLLNCTLQGNVNGVDVISTNNRPHLIAGCHITDNSGFGIDFNGGTSGGIATVVGCRFRDNGADTTGYADWVTGTSFRTITTDTGAAATDYVDAATTKDFRLISTAAGYRQGFAYNANIGACGDNVTASGGGNTLLTGCPLVR